MSVGVREWSVNTLGDDGGSERLMCIASLRMKYARRSIHPWVQCLVCFCAELFQSSMVCEFSQFSARERAVAASSAVRACAWAVAVEILVSSNSLQSLFVQETRFWFMWRCGHHHWWFICHELVSSLRVQRQLRFLNALVVIRFRYRDSAGRSSVSNSHLHFSN